MMPTNDFEAFDYLYGEISKYILDNYDVTIGIVNEISSLDAFDDTDIDSIFDCYYSYISINFNVNDMDYKVQIPFDDLLGCYYETGKILEVLNVVDDAVEQAIITIFKSFKKS